MLHEKPPLPFYWSDERLGAEPLEAIADDVVERAEAKPDLEAMTPDEIDELIAVTPLLEGAEFCRWVTVEMCARYWRSIRSEPNPKIADELAEAAQEEADGSDSALAKAFAAECQKAALALNDPRNGPEPGEGEEPPDDGAPANEGDGGVPEEPLPKLIPIRFVKGEIIPPREWIVRDWIPKRKVTLLQGDGGDGKTPLLQQLQSSCATALPWIGLLVEECDSVGFYTEDEDRDLKERQAAIDAAYGQYCISTGKMHLFSMADEESQLVVFDRNRNPILTKVYRQACEAALDYRAQLVTLDVQVDLFGGHEIERTEVRAFMRPLNRLARQIDGAVILAAHVSQAGIRNDGGHSGSTDWSNAARSRLYLNRPKSEKNGELVDTNERLLTRKKANYASIGDTVKLRWQNGLIVPDAPEAPGATPFGKLDAKALFLSLLVDFEGMGRPLSANNHAGNFAPRTFANLPREKRLDYRLRDFELAMERLFADGAIENKTPETGSPSKRSPRIVRTAR